MEEKENMTENKTNKTVGVLRGIGESRLAALSKMGVETLGELLSHYPRAYQNRGDTKTLAEIRDKLNEGCDGPFSVVLTVSCEPTTVMPRRGMFITKVRVFDETGAAEAVYFNQQYVRDIMHTGAEFRFFGKFSLVNSKIQISNPIYEPHIEGRQLRDIVPVYSLTAGITQKLMASLVDETIKICGSELIEYMPKNILSEMALPTYAYTIKNIHFPESVEAIAAAKRRLVFDELYFMFLLLAVRGEKEKKTNSKIIKNTGIDVFFKMLPFEMTNAQLRSVHEILSDMSGKYFMNRILTGDVGSGKTAVAAAAAYAAVNNGYRVAIMAPTEILANQHFESFTEMFEHLGIKCALLTGSVKKSEKNTILKGLSNNSSDEEKIDIIIGTHSLISDDVVIERLGLAVIDEQHRFGVMQRAALFEKAEDLHCLVMSATPIPRTLTLAAYGSINVSRIDELPKGRQKTETFIVNERYRERLNKFIEKQVFEGHQVYVVCPAVDEREAFENPEEISDISLLESFDDTSVPLKAATKFAEYLKEELPELRIGFVHGKQKPKERDTVMKSFIIGELDVLVATTVIEVGVNVPNATLMIVENAERFGLSQLHQLRGRVGRGSAQSYFILVSETKNSEALARLRAIKDSSDGFEIAEYDLKQRGPGDFIGDNGTIRQHGEMNFRLAASCRDTDLIERAAFYAKRTAAEDPRLEKEENRMAALKLEAYRNKAEKISN